MNRHRLRDILDLTWPQTAMLLCQFVVGITDVWAAGRLGSDVQASIGLIAQCQMLLMTLAFAGSGGAVAAVSQSLGARRLLRARRYVGLVLIGGVLVGLVPALIGFWLRIPFLQSVRTPEAIMPTALLFLEVYLATLPFQYVLTIGGAVFRASKSVRIPLYVTAGVGVINVAGDLGFGLGWWGIPAYGAAGIAWSTFASVTLGAAALTALAVREGLFTAQSFAPLRWIRKGAPYLFKVAGPALLTSVLWQGGYVILFAVTAALPENSVTILAGLTAGFRLEAVLFLPAVAFNMTASVLVGHRLGERNGIEAQRTALTILGVGCGVMTLVGVVMWPLRGELAAFLTLDAAVQTEIIRYLSFNIMSVPFTVTGIILVGVFNGAGATFYPLVSLSSAVWLVRLPSAWILGHVFLCGANGVFAAMLLSQIVQASLLLFVLLRCDWKRFAMTARHEKERQGA